MNWHEKQVGIYLDEKDFKGMVNFYYKTKCDTVDTVQIYNLKPNTNSYFKDIKVCDKCCNTGGFCSGVMSKFNMVLMLICMVMYYIWGYD